MKQLFLIFAWNIQNKSLLCFVREANLLVSYWILLVLATDSTQSLLLLIPKSSLNWKLYKMGSMMHRHLFFCDVEPRYFIWNRLINVLCAHFFTRADLLCLSECNDIVLYRISLPSKLWCIYMKRNLEVIQNSSADTSNQPKAFIWSSIVFQRHVFGYFGIKLK